MGPILVTSHAPRVKFDNYIFSKSYAMLDQVLTIFFGQGILYSGFLYSVLLVKVSRACRIVGSMKKFCSKLNCLKYLYSLSLSAHCCSANIMDILFTTSCNKVNEALISASNESIIYRVHWSSYYQFKRNDINNFHFFDPMIDPGSSQ